jgi:hypothetical protein
MQSPSDEHDADDETLELTTSTANEEELLSQGNHSQGIETIPYASDFDRMLALSPILREMASTYVHSLTITSIRKA